MSNFAAEIQKLDDEQLAIQLSNPMPGSTNHELVKFEMQRRAMLAQRKAAEASERAAIAAERYTRATYIFIAVTALAALLNAGILVLK